MDHDRWDVVTALFPFTDASVRKPRPVPVLSNALFNRMHGHLIGSMITTGAGSHWPSDHPIVDLATTGLAHSSLVRWKVFTLPAALPGKRIGCLSEVDRDAVKAQLAKVLL